MAFPATSLETRGQCLKSRASFLSFFQHGETDRPAGILELELRRRILTSSSYSHCAHPVTGPQLELEKPRDKGNVVFIPHPRKWPPGPALLHGPL